MPPLLYPYPSSLDTEFPTNKPIQGFYVVRGIIWVCVFLSVGGHSFILFQVLTSQDKTLEQNKCNMGNLYLQSYHIACDIPSSHIYLSTSISVCICVCVSAQVSLIIITILDKTEQRTGTNIETLSTSASTHKQQATEPGAIERHSKYLVRFRCKTLHFIDDKTLNGTHFLEGTVKWCRQKG